ncbi:MAG: hypothetical protein U0353_11135 [Sandaracinus sp.]
MRLALASLIVLASLSLAPRASAQNNQTVTEQCAILRAMQWLDNATTRGGNGLSAEHRGMLDARERVACATGSDAAQTEYWPNGGLLRSGGAWYYPNGGMYQSGAGAFYYSNGGMFSASDSWYYPNGGMLTSGGNWYAPDGSMSSETGLLTLALSRIARERGDQLLGLRQQERTDFWRMVYLVALVWEATH